MSKGLDEILETHNDGINKGQIIELELILKAIEAHKLTEIYQVEGLINNRLDELKGEQ